jgi:TP901 family phage tail tape measure protein
MSDFLLRAVVGIKDDASGPAGRIGGYFVNLKEKIKATEGGLASFNNHMAELKSGAKFLAVGSAAGMLAKSFISADIEAAKLTSQIRSLGVSQGEVDGVTSKVRVMAGEMGTAQEILLSGIWDLKSAVSTLDPKQLVDVAKALDMTAKATKGDFGGLSNLFGTTYSQFKDMYKGLSDTQLAGLFGNTITKVSNLYKTDGAAMQQAMQSLGSTAAAMNVSLEEQSVVLGKMQNTDLAGVSGTAYKSFISKVSSGMKEFNLSAEGFKGKLKSMPDLLESLSKVLGDTIEPAEMEKLTKAFGEEGARMVTTLMPKYKSLRNEIAEVKAANADGNWKYMKEAAAINMDNLSTGLDRTGAGWKALQSTIANGFNEGPLKVIINGLADIFTGLTKILNEHSVVRQFVSTLIFGGTSILLLTGAFKITNATIGLYTLLTKAAGTGTTGLGFSMKSIIPSIWSAVTATWSFTAALLANPITWVAIGVAALITGIVLLVKNWDTVKAAFIGTWNSIRNTWSNAPGWFKGIVALMLLPFWPFIQLGKVIINNWSGIKTFFGTLFTSIKKTVTEHFDVLATIMLPVFAPFIKITKLIINNWTEIKLFLSGIFEWVKTKVSELVSWVGDKIGVVWEPLKSGLSAIGDFFFGDMSKKAEKSGKGFATGWAKGVRSNTDVVNKAVGSVMQSVSHYLPHSDAKIGPLSNLTKSGRSFVSTWTGGVDNEARSNNVVSRFINLQAKQINEKSPVVQKIAAGNKTEAKNLFGNLAISVEGKDMSVNKLASMLAQVLSQELNRIEAV